MESYENQRLDRLTDAIFDYIQDDKTSARNLYLDIRNEVESIREYHKKYMDKCNDLLDHLNGFREIDLDYSDYEQPNDVIVGSISTSTSSDWDDFWGTDYYPY